MAGRRGKRCIVVGDVHGCLEELEELLDMVALGAEDRLVFVGDLVAKGPDSVGVVHLARALGAEAVMGNHDKYLIDHHHGRRDPSEVSEQVKKIEKKLSDADWDWLEHLPCTVELPEHASIVVHAGLVPGVPLAKQRPEDMLTMRSIRKDGTATKRIEEGEPWASLWKGPPHVYFGHDAVRGLQRYPHATGLDTACVYGGKLSAAVLPAREIVSVKAKKMYSMPGKTIAARHAPPSAGNGANGSGSGSGKKK